MPWWPTQGPRCRHTVVLGRRVPSRSNATIPAALVIARAYEYRMVGVRSCLIDGGGAYDYTVANIGEPDLAVGLEHELRRIRQTCSSHVDRQRRDLRQPTAKFVLGHFPGT